MIVYSWPRIGSPYGANDQKITDRLMSKVISMLVYLCSQHQSVTIYTGEPTLSRDSWLLFVLH